MNRRTPCIDRPLSGKNPYGLSRGLFFSRCDHNFSIESARKYLFSSCAALSVSIDFSCYVGILKKGDIKLSGKFV